MFILDDSIKDSTSHNFINLISVLREITFKVEIVFIMDGMSITFMYSDYEHDFHITTN